MYAPNSRKFTELQQTLNKPNTVCAEQQADILLHKCTQSHTHTHGATNNFSFSILVIHLKYFQFNYLRTMLNVKSVARELLWVNWKLKFSFTFAFWYCISIQ